MAVTQAHWTGLIFAVVVLIIILLFIKRKVKGGMRVYEKIIYPGERERREGRTDDGNDTTGNTTTSSDLPEQQAGDDGSLSRPIQDEQASVIKAEPVRRKTRFVFRKG